MDKLVIVHRGALRAKYGANYADLMKRIAESAPGLDERIQELMFVFEDLRGIPNKDFQLLLREITTDKLALALKGADSTLTHKVTTNMSVRAAEIFVDDLEN